MRTLIISDIHGNLAALEAVATEPHDQVICLGDIVGYGPEPAACVEWVREHAAMVVPGNHDRAASDGSPTQCRGNFRPLAEAVAAATESRLGRAERDYLGSLPLWSFFGLSRRTYLALHATPRNPLYRYVGNNRQAWAVELIGVEADVVLVGHTHLQFRLEVGLQLVINPGSVGQPKDGDPRAAYAVIEGSEIMLKRVAYPIERTVAELGKLDLTATVLDQLAAMLRTGDPTVVSAQSGDVETQ